MSSDVWESQNGAKYKQIEVGKGKNTGLGEARAITQSSLPLLQVVECLKLCSEQSLQHIPLPPAMNSPLPAGKINLWASNLTLFAPVALAEHQPTHHLY